MSSSDSAAGPTALSGTTAAGLPLVRLDLGRVIFHSIGLNFDDAQGLVTAAGRACSQQTDDQISQHPNVARRMRQVEQAIRTQIDQFLGQMDSKVKFDAQNLSDSGMEICAALVSCPPGREWMAMDHCHNYYRVSIADMLAAITGSAMLKWIFRDFSVVKNVPPSNSVDEVLGFLGPGKLKLAIAALKSADFLNKNANSCVRR